ncbi:MAG: type II toxin-antitoxin system VapC family toxin [Polyangiaceae bacterium]|nr:type II toxin-antitoxin system VapC family toxin [Polyangiaceae bacterium]MCW5790818.1 type II toxin-antitoxin system VapC family toxin [Polyangiaceae bacterium]
MRLALDTNTYRLIMEGDPDAVHLVRRAEQVLMPVPVLAELRFGFLSGTRGRENEAFLVRFLDRARVVVLSCDEETAERFATLKLQLKRQGTPIPIHDVWIAALVLQHGATLFTKDSDFARIPQLPRV